MADPPIAGGDASRPERIGPYRILDVLGEGGMGTVFLAEQKEPVRRRVALKVIKLGMDTKEVLNRFEAERQALAMMEHGSIARVLDAGATEGGRPYLAMEYVKGVPITNYCDEHKLRLRQRLALFQQVCSGVQHAHQKGVIHRDLKPGNILVTVQDGQPRAKIIDFGLARATDHRLIEATLYTQQGQTIGTPEYMSPEQAGFGGTDIDTRTDVYSLGVVLYELLTGSLPFSSAELRQAGLLEVQRKIREDDPPKPSTRLMASTEATATLAARRQIDSATLLRRLRGELDWIVMRAIEKDRTRRYETASALADDIQRHLDDEPVLASPPSASYRLRKLARRYRGTAIAATIVLMVLIGGIVGTSIGMFNAAEQSRLADAAAERANEQQRVAEDNAAEAQRQQARAAIAAAESALRFHETGRAKLWLAEVPVELRQWEWRYLHAVSDQARMVLNSGSISLYRAIYSPDERRILTAAWTDGRAILWDADTGVKLQELMGHEQAVSEAAFSPDGMRAATASWDGTVRIWDMATGVELLRLQLGGEAGAVAFSPVMGDNRVVTAGQGGAVVVWSAAGEKIQSLPGLTGFVELLAFNSEGTRIVAGGGETTALVWDVASGAVVRTLGGHLERVRSAMFNPDGTRVLTTDGSGIARLWNIESPDEPPLELRGHDPGRLFATFGPTGTRVLTGSTEDSTARLWNAISGEELMVLRSQLRGIERVAFSPDGKQLIAAGFDSTVTLWDASSGQQLALLMGHEREMMSLRWNRDGSRVLTANNDGTARIWDVRPDPRLPQAIGQRTAGKVLDVAVGDAGVAAVTVLDDGTVAVYTPAGTRVVESGDQPVKAALSRGGSRLAVGHESGAVRVWTDAGDLGFVIAAVDSAVSALAFRQGPDEARILAGYADGTVAVRWIGPARPAPLDLLGHGTAVEVVAFSPDGSLIVAGYQDRLARVWDAASGKELAVLTHEEGGGYERVYVAAFSPDGRRLFTGGGRDDHKIYLWDAATFELRHHLIGHAKQSHSLAFSPDETRIVTASEDLTARIWDAESGTELLALRHDAKVQKAEFSPDGSYLVTLTTDNTVRIWDTVPVRERRR